MNWKEVSVLTEGVCVEAIAEIFHHLGSGGVIIEDPQAARKYVKKEAWDPQAVSQDFLKHEFIVIKGYFPLERQVMDELKLGLDMVESSFGIKCQMYIDEVKDEDWESSWKKYYHTFKVGERLIIKPSWEEYQAQENEIVIEIDPGMAFGTGIHASTRFCLVFLDEYLKGGERVIDAGCGSGILSIAAAKLGASSLEAMDIDEVAVRIAKENTALNGLEGIINIRSGNIVEEMEKMRADIILANITAEVVERLIPRAAQILPAGGFLFGSGIVDSRWPGVERQLKNCGFTIDRILTDTDWMGVAAVKSQ